MRLIYLAAFSLFLMVSFLVPTHANAVACQSNTQVVFSNGVFNSRDDARDSRDFLDQNLGVRAGLNPVALAYVNDGGAALTLTGMLPGMGQLLELFLQKQVVDNTNNFWAWLSGSVPAPQWFLDGMKQIAAGINATNYVFDSDLKNHVSIYKGYLNAGNRVTIVSHSQGNFYSNAAHRLLTQAGMGNNVGIVAVATPTGVVEGGGPHVTASEDLVIKSVRILSFGIGVLPANVSNATRPTGADFLNHNFIKFYMKGIETKTSIMSAITQIVSALQPPFSTTDISTNRHSYTVNGEVFSRSFCYSDTNIQFDASISFPANSVGRVGTVKIRPTSQKVPSPTIMTDTFSEVFLPNGGMRFYQFVSIPNGVGLIYIDDRTTANYIMNAVLDDLVITGISTVHMKAYTWGEVNNIWSVSQSSITMPSYGMSVTNYVCHGFVLPDPNILGLSQPCSFLPPSDMPGVVFVMAYDPIVLANSQFYFHTPYMYQTDRYNSVAVFYGRVDDTYAPWQLVTVINGVLGVSGGGSITAADIVPRLKFGRYNYYVFVDIGVPVNTWPSFRMRSYNDADWIEPISSSSVILKVR